MTLNDISTHVFVINLKKRLDRRQHIIEQLETIDCLQYNIVEAVDYTNSVANCNIKKGALGLTKSWIKIKEQFENSNADELIIIEDDCLFLPNFNQNLEAYFNHIPDDWHIIYFGANHNYHTGSTTEKINEWCIKLNNSYSAHCVVLKKQVFDRVIHYVKATQIEVDLVLSQFQKEYNAYSSYENLTTQIPGHSDIEEKFVDYNWLIK